MSTIEITSISQYIKEVIKISNNKENKSSQLYYRGEPSYYRHRTPTLYRDKNLALKGSEKYYRKLINELGRDNNTDGSSLFRVLSELQHYEAKTRMLDISTNPLVALYFAVEKNSKDNGYIFIYSNKNREEKFDTSPTINIFTALNFIPIKEYNVFDSYSRSAKKFISKNFDILYKHYAINEKIHSINEFTIEEIFNILELEILKRELLIKNADNKWQFLGMNVRKDALEWVNKRIAEDPKGLDTIEKHLLALMKRKMLNFMNKINRICMGNFEFIYPFKIIDDLSKSQIVLTSKNTDRIRQQQGAFIYPAYSYIREPYEETSDGTLKDIQKKVHDSINELNIESNQASFVIDKSKKEEIRNNLASIGITKGFIYADIRRQSETLLQ